MQTTAVSVSTVCTAAVGGETVKEAVNHDSSDVQNFDFEYEGSIIMKKYAAILSSLLILTNGTAANAQPETYMPENSDIEYAEAAKAFIDENDLDLDLNCDGKLDIFDLYAFYRAEVSDKEYQLVGTTVGTIPDYIWEKYKALPKKFKVERTYTDSGTAKQVIGEFDYTFDTSLIMDYYFTYYHDIELDYFEPDFYMDNRPDDYQDDFPYDFIRHGGKPWNMWEFQKTMYLKKESDGSYRFYNENDAKAALKNISSFYSETAMRYMKDLKVSPIHEFITKLRYITHSTGVDYPLMKEFVESGYADTDINSNGTFDFEDITKIAKFAERHSDCKEKTFIDHIFYPERNEFRDYFDNEYYTNIINENEWNKASSFCDTAANYFNNNTELSAWIMQHLIVFLSL